MSTLPDPDFQPEFYADVPGKRLLAFFIDTIIIIGLCVLVLPFTAFTGLFFSAAVSGAGLCLSGGDLGQFGRHIGHAGDGH